MVELPCKGFAVRTAYDLIVRSFGTPSETLLPVDEAVARVLAEISPLGTEVVPLAQGHRRVLRQDVVAPADVPPHDNSAMDGYALRSGNTPGRLRVIEDLRAGRFAEHAVKKGTAIRIMTGAPMPSGADAVVPIEQVTVERTADEQTLVVVRQGDRDVVFQHDQRRVRREQFSQANGRARTR